jgi:hypothetical protein
MENVLLPSHVMFRKGILWLNALNVEKKSVLLPSLGRWLDEQTKVARKQNLQSDSSTIAEKLSELP